MRLWHYKLIHLLPNSQLLAQWRELNSIFANGPRHILIDYVYDCRKSDLKAYADMVIREMESRGFAIRSMDNYSAYFGSSNPCHDEIATPFGEFHDDEYLAICYFNLLEKYRRGQKDFRQDRMFEIRQLCRDAIDNYFDDYFSYYVDYKEETR